MKLKNKLAAAAITGALIVPAQAQAQAQAMEDYFTNVSVENTPQGERVHVYRKGGRSYLQSAAASSKLRNEMWDEYKRKTPPHLHGQNMHDQLSCHVFNARFKDPWNLESWRPDVGYSSTVLALCNP